MKKTKLYSKIINISLSSFLIVSLCFCCIFSLKPKESYAYINENVSCIKLFDNITGYVSSQNVIKHNFYTFSTPDEEYIQNPYYNYTTFNIQYFIDEDSPYYNNLNGMLLYLSEPSITDAYPLYVLSNISDSVYIQVSYFSVDNPVTLEAPHDYYMYNALMIQGIVKPVYQSDSSVTNVYYVNFGDSFNPQDEVYINVRFCFINQVSKWSTSVFGSYANFVTEITQGENSDFNFLHCNFLTYDENALFSYDDAYTKGYEKGRIDTEKDMKGLIAKARQQGYDEGLSAQGSFWSYFASIGEAPLTILKQMFDIEILGVSMNTFVFSILGALAVIKIIRLFI